VARIGVDRQTGGERQRPIIEALAAQQVVAKRPGDGRRAAPGEPREESRHDLVTI
jgi:hypothetical protein